MFNSPRSDVCGRFASVPGNSLMGQQDVNQYEDPAGRRRFEIRLLRDVEALERMIVENRFDRGPRRIGAEQELALIDERGIPAPVALELLERINDERVVPELAIFNLEINGSPRVLAGDCFSQMLGEFDDVLETIRTHGAKMGVRPVLVGILPSAQLKHIQPSNITPYARYVSLDQRLTELRGGSHPLHIRGTDEISIKHESIMTEAVNTSFQVHLQVSPEEFGLAHNIAQLVTAPALAVSTNAPLYLGRRLWSETRIPIFEQTIDTRRPEFHERRDVGRVRFGERWVSSVVDLYTSDISLLRSICIDEDDEDSLAELDAGRIPKLRALGMHNSTVYRWNRACYGLTDGVPHLRIENRVLPSGPTTLDEISSAAFWIGLVLAGMKAWPDVATRMDFDDARSNFTAAARRGLRTKVQWIDGKTHAMDALVLEQLAPMAIEGLTGAGVGSGEAQRLISVVTRRVETANTGSRWLLRAVRYKGGATATNLRAVTSAMANLQGRGVSINEWPELPEIPDRSADDDSSLIVDEAMTRELVTVHPSDSAAFGHRLMQWRSIHQLPVEDEDHRLLGVLDWGACEARSRGELETATVADLMRTASPVAEAGTLIGVVAEQLLGSGLDSVPVVADEQLIGIFTRTDLSRLNLDAPAPEPPGGVDAD